jgi:deoxyribonuclease-4
MELEFVRGVRMKEGMAQRVRETAEEENIVLSVHAPYYINLNSAEAEKIRASIERIYRSARIGALWHHPSCSILPTTRTRAAKR